MRMSTDRTDEILIGEMEKLLDDVAPSEADLAASYVQAEPEYERVQPEEKRYGIPGAGLAVLVGPILLHYVVVIAMDVLAAARKKGAEAIAAEMWNYLSSKVRRSLPAKDRGRTETIDAIVKALKAAGWDDERAGAAADLAWESGIETGRRFSELVN
jgi:hypothetical protein